MNRFLWQPILRKYLQSSSLTQSSTTILQACDAVEEGMLKESSAINAFTPFTTRPKAEQKDGRQFSIGVNNHRVGR